MADEQQPFIYAFGPYRLDPLRRVLWCGETMEALTSRTFDTLLILIQNSGKTVSKETLMERVWAGASVEENNLTQCISALRKVFGESRSEHRFIATISGEGYRFVAEVRRQDAGSVRSMESVEPAHAAEGDGQKPTVKSLMEQDGLSPEKPGASSWPHHLTHAWGFHSLTSRTVAIGAICMIMAGFLVLIFRGSKKEPPVPPARTGPVVQRSQRRGPVTLAVLPFANLTGDPDEADLTNGMAEETITRLSRSDLKRMRVIARTAVTKYQGSRKDIRQIGRELGAAYILEGSVRKSGNRLRVLARLIRAEDQVTIWGKSYDRPLDDLIEVQQDVARAICTEVQAQLPNMLPQSDFAE